MNIKNLLNRVSQNPTVAKAFHTFYQAALGVLVVGLFAAHSSTDVKALLVAAVAAGVSAVKSSLVARLRG